MEQEFIKVLNTEGWLKAIEKVKMPTEFWMKNFKQIPNNYVIRNYILVEQDLEEYFIAYVIKQGWMEPRGISENDNMNWGVISISQKLSEDFIRKFADKLDWQFISLKQELSEPFMEEFIDRLDWWHIARWQKLSESFIERHRNKMDKHQLQINKHI